MRQCPQPLLCAFCFAFLIVVGAAFVPRRAAVVYQPQNISAAAPPLSPAVLGAAEQKTLNENIARLPLYFEANEGQADAETRFISRTASRAFFLKTNGAELRFLDLRKQPASLNFELVESNPNAAVKGVDPLSNRVNYFVGTDSQKWRSNIATFGKVKYEAVYPGVDLVYYGNQQFLEYDFIVAPHADASVVKLRFDNADSLKITSGGDLLIRKNGQIIRQRRPVAYQEINGERREVAANYRKVQNSKFKVQSEIAFELGDYDADQPLVIDPVIVFSTFVGGSGGDTLFNPEAGFSIAADQTGVYLAGVTPSFDFPTLNPAQANSGGFNDGFLTKLNPTGTAILYSTYYGGMEDDRILALAIDSAGQVYATGFTASPNLPLVTPFQNSFQGAADGFIARFSNAGALNYSSYFGGSGSDFAKFIRPDGGGGVYLTGDTDSANFPVFNALQPTNNGGADFFVSRLNLTNNALAFSTYLGGSGNESAATSIQSLDAAGNIYVGGVSASNDFPATANAFQVNNNGSDDAVVAKLSATGSSLLYATYVGGNLIDNAGGLAVDPTGNAYITGFTRSSNYPLRNAAQTQLNDPDAFVTKINPTGSNLVYSTFLGGSNLERGAAIYADAGGSAYVTGRSNSGNFPTRRAVRPPRGLDDVFVTKFNRGGALLFSTLIGGSSNDNGFGIVADDANNAFVTGIATRNFPVTANALQPAVNGEADAFAIKINTATRKVRADFDGDGKTDYAVFRPSNGFWYVLNSSDNVFRAVQFGMNGDAPVPGDYDADGRADFAVYRSNEGRWYILNSSNNAFRAIYWGGGADKPVQGDYDGDDRTDIAVYRPSNGAWYIINSSNNNVRTPLLGQAGDVPVPADYDGDSFTDIAVYTPSNGVWYSINSFSGFSSTQFGISTDRPVPADYDGDGYDDIAVFRASNGFWYYRHSITGVNTDPVVAVQFGQNGDIPSPGDFDGDARDNLTVFRPGGGIWYVSNSRNSGLTFQQFGQNGDIPISSAYTPQ